MENLIDRLIDDFHEREFPELMPRHKAFARVPRKANVVIGMRRSGKTFFCFQQMRELVKSGVEKERLLHLNLENERLLPFSARDFQTVLDTYYRNFPAFKNEQCYLFLDEVQRIDGRQVNPSKVYVIDPGLLEAMSLHMTEDRGALLETLVYMQLRRQGNNPEYYFTKNGAGVDFILAADNRRRRQLIQVCWTIREPRTQEREVGALLTAMRELGLKHGTLITWLEEESPDDHIDVVPAWRWLLRR